MRIIDADDFVLKLRELKLVECTIRRDVSPRNSIRWWQYQTIIWFINAIIEKLNDPDYTPTIDAEPVRHGKKGKSTISSTGLMCTACYSDIDDDAVFCKYCGAKVEEDENGTEQR